MTKAVFFTWVTTRLRKYMQISPVMLWQQYQPFTGKGLDLIKKPIVEFWGFAAMVVSEERVTGNGQGKILRPRQSRE